ncbi:hypothetical protein VTG60DRAFT_6042 [Thermothelomyces hinnuleus]
MSDGRTAMSGIDAVTGSAAEFDWQYAADFSMESPGHLELHFRLATEEDVETLEKMSDDSAALDEGSLHGFQKACRPTGHLLALLRRAKMYTENNFFTCVIAEYIGDNPCIPRGTVVGYSIWGWVEYIEDDEGGLTVRMGMLPRVLDLWDKHLPDCKKPNENTRYRPRVLQHRVMPDPTKKGSRMRSKQPQLWALHDMEWDKSLEEWRIEAELISWGCRIADEEKIWLCVFRWPLLRSDEFLVQGFDDHEILPDYKLTDLDGVEQSLSMVKLRRKPQERRRSAGGELLVPAQ